MSAESLMIVTKQQDLQRKRKIDSANDRSKIERRKTRSVLGKLEKSCTVDIDQLHGLQQFQKFRARKSEYLLKKIARAYDPIASPFEIDLGMEVIQVRYFSEINGYGKLTLKKVKSWIDCLSRSGIQRVMVRFSNSHQIKKLRNFLMSLGLALIAFNAIPGHVLLEVA